MITIIDYGLGNIQSFANVYKRLNMPCSIATNPKELEPAQKLILPGVGAFDHAMTLLQDSGMRETLDELVLDKKIPIIGICVGMQILANSSEEGALNGLKWIDGEVKKFDVPHLPFKTGLPHMGWNNVNPTENEPIFEGLDSSSRFYFLHSYYFSCNNASNVIATADYGVEFCCTVKRDNIYGVQFHPEKSHSNGITVLKNFGNL